jgi:hypothetical protein
MTTKFYVEKVDTKITKELSAGLGITKHHVCNLVYGVYTMQASVLEMYNEGKTFQLTTMYTYFKGDKVLGSESFSYTPVEWSLEDLKEVAENHCRDTTIGQFAYEVEQFETK